MSIAPEATKILTTTSGVGVLATRTSVLHEFDFVYLRAIHGCMHVRLGASSSQDLPSVPR